MEVTKGPAKPCPALLALLGGCGEARRPGAPWSMRLGKGWADPTWAHRVRPPSRADKARAWRLSLTPAPLPFPTPTASAKGPCRKIPAAPLRPGFFQWGGSCEACLAATEGVVIRQPCSGLPSRRCPQGSGRPWLLGDKQAGQGSRARDVLANRK